ncbi:Gx transporter family protein [Anoxybacterium hadale]|uniref:Gx transporter family protein n=1 Tax=Anoxybacterium hadale TaxID=3408580 RepID=A0ACD1A721_9FIRM|nr:Gx transporter family protein [Clostridiales bacterium]
MNVKYSGNTILKSKNKTQLMVLTAMVFATALVLAVIENALPALPIAVPGVKFGLSNIAVMYALFFLGRKEAYTIAVLKSGFVFVTRGAIAAALSLAGGILSITVMVLLIFLFREKISYLILSIFGAVFHNVGQFAVITIIYTGMNLWAYFPVLLVSGLLAGIVTSTLLRFIMPAFNRIG